jgi:hypothetical protein
LNIVVRYEAYFKKNGYSRYHQFSIAPKNRYKIAFVTYWDIGGFLYGRLYRLEFKNGPPTYHKVVTKTFRKL